MSANPNLKLNILNDSSTQIFTINQTSGINSNLISLYTNTTTSTNSTSASFVLSGGLSISSTANATSITRGGALTIAGGMSVNNDSYVGGTIFTSSLSSGSLFNTNQTTTNIVTTAISASTLIGTTLSTANVYSSLCTISNLVGTTLSSSNLIVTNISASNYAGLINKVWNTHDQGISNNTIGSATPAYYKLATLSTTGDGSNGANLTLDGYISQFNNIKIGFNILISSRGGLNIIGTAQGNSIANLITTGDIAIYTETNGTFSVYAVKKNQFLSWDIRTGGGLGVTLFEPSTTNTTSPTGTLTTSSVLSSVNTIINNGLMGIGTTSPSTSVHIYNNAPVLRIQDNTDSTVPDIAGRLELVQTNGTGLRITYDGAADITRFDQLSVGITNGGLLTISNGGSTQSRIGIGNTSPVTSLDVSGGCRITETITAATLVGTTLSTANIYGSLGTVSNFVGTTLSAGTLLATISTIPNIVHTNITTSSIIVARTTSAPSIILTNSDPWQSEFRIDNTSMGGTGGTYSFLVGGTGNTTGVGVGPGNFGIYDNSASTFRLIISTSGNIGINTSTPSTRLDVNGIGRITTSLTTGALFSTNQTTTNIVGTTISAGTLVATASIIPNISHTNMTVNSIIVTSGGLGVGTTAPSNAFVIGSALQNMTLSMSSNFGQYSSIEAFDSNNPTQKRSLTLNAFGGNVGVGTTSPSNTLDVNGTGRITTSLTTGALFSTNQTTTNIVSTNISAGTLVGTTLSTANVYGSLGTVSNFVGTTLSSSNLISTVSTISNIVSIAISSGTLAGTTMSTANVYASLGTISNFVGTTLSAGTFVGTTLSVTNVNASSITSNGLLTNDDINFGATGVYSVTGNDNSAFRFGTNSPVKPGLVINAINRSVEPGRVSLRHNNYISLEYVDGTNFTSHVILTSSGNVGIGTTSPSNILDVSGTGRITTSLTTGALFSTNQTTTNIVSTNISAGTLVGTTLSTANVYGSLGTVSNFVGTTLSSSNLVATTSTIPNIVHTNISSGTLTLSTTTESDNSTTGALIITGGLGLAKALTLGNHIRTQMLRPGMSFDGPIDNGWWYIGRFDGGIAGETCIIEFNSGSGFNGGTDQNASTIIHLRSGNGVGSNIGAIMSRFGATNLFTAIQVSSESTGNVSTAADWDIYVQQATRFHGRPVVKIHTGNNAGFIQSYTTVGSVTATNGTTVISVTDSYVIRTPSAFVNTLAIGTTGNSSLFTLDVTGTGRISTSLTTGALFSTNQTTTNIVGTTISAGTFVGTTLSTANVSASVGTITNLLTTNQTVSNIASSSANLFLGVMNGIGIAGSLRIGRNDGFSTIRYHDLECVTSTTQASSYMAIKIHNASTTTSQTEVMRLRGDGNVGIGTTAPAFTLDVNGSGDFVTFVTSGSLFSTNQTTTNIVATTSTIPNIIHTNMTINSIIVTSGGLGVGSTAPSNTFVVGSATQNIDLSMSSNFGQYSSIEAFDRNNPSQKRPIALNAFGGSVGVGTTAPANTLDVIGTGRITTSLTTGALFSTNQTTTNIVTTTISMGTLRGTTGTIGSFAVTGALSKGSGTFDIEHPTQSTKRLVHSFIEGPRCDLIYRGKAKLVNGTININLDTDCVAEPDCAMTLGTFEALCRNPQYFLQNHTSFSRIKGNISGNILTIISEDINSTDEIYWTVIAERKDQYIYTWNKTNINGYLKCEHSTLV